MPDKKSEDRRLDSLARVCVLPQITCVAICCINSKFYITANSLYTTTKRKVPGGAGKNDFQKLLENLWEYLKQQPKDSENIAHEKIFKQICSIEKMQGEYGREGNKCTIDIYNKAIEWALQNKDSLPLLSEVQKIHGHNEGVAYFGYGVALALHKDLLKIKQGLEEESDKFSPEQVRAFQSISTILFGENEPGIHAEVQMLSKIVQEVKEHKIIKDEYLYIGISRNCCLECHFMLEAAKEVLQENNNICIDFRGAHDLSFENWLPPTLFKKGYEDIDCLYVDESIEYQIGKKAREKINSVLPAKGVSMGAEGSDSEPEETTPQKIKFYKDKLKYIAENICNFDDTITILQLKNMIEVGEKLISVDAFLNLFRYPVDAKAESCQAKDTFERILIGYKAAHKEDLARSKLFNFIKNPGFGQIAIYFTTLSEEILNTEQYKGKISKIKLNKESAAVKIQYFYKRYIKNRPPL